MYEPGTGSDLVEVARASAAPAGVEDPMAADALASSQQVAARPAAPIRGPKLVVDQPTFNFGSMERNEVRSHNFKIRNGGEAPLELTEIAASCKCLSMQLSETSLAPGEEGFLRVEWSGSESTNTLLQRVRVRSNDPDNDIFEFTVLGSIVSVIGVSPGRLELSGLPFGAPVEERLEVLSRVWPSFRVSGVTASLEGAELTAARLPASRLAAFEEGPLGRVQSGWSIDFRLPEGAVRGDMTGEVGFTVTEAARDGEGATKEIRVPVQLKVVRPITVSGPGAVGDRLLKLGRAARSTELTRKFLIKVTDSAPELAVAKTAVSPDYLRVALEPLKVNERSALYRLVVVVPPGVEGALMGDKAGKIRLEFDHPRVRELELDVELAPSI